MPSSLGETLRSARLARDLTQVQLARLLDIDDSLVSRYETGQKPPALTLVRLARILRLNVSVNAESAAEKVTEADAVPQARP